MSNQIRSSWTSQKLTITGIRKNRKWAGGQNLLWIQTPKSAFSISPKSNMWFRLCRRIQFQSLSVWLQHIQIIVGAWHAISGNNLLCFIPQMQVITHCGRFSYFPIKPLSNKSSIQKERKKEAKEKGGRHVGIRRQIFFIHSWGPPTVTGCLAGPDFTRWIKPFTGQELNTMSSLKV